jgi:hypothetical protein
MNRVRVGWTVLAGGVLLAALGSGVPVGAAPQSKVSFCHRTSSVQNPYNLKTSDGNSIINQGHGDHTGPVFPSDNWGDIIPPFDYDDGHYPGLNWTGDGQAVFSAGCDVDEEPPDQLPTTTTTTPPSTSVTTTSLPTTSAGTTTTAPGSTTAPPPTSGIGVSPTTIIPGGGPGSTTTVPPGSETPPSTTPPTVAPIEQRPTPVTAPPLGVNIMPELHAVVVTPGGAVVDLGALSVPQRIWLAAELRRRIAATGGSSEPLSLIASVLIVVGAGLLAAAAQRRGHRVG